MKFKINVLVILIVLSTVFSAFGATYYISNDGNDSNSGLSDAQAWASVGMAHSNLSSGDEVYFKCGSTFDHRLGGWGSAIVDGTSGNHTVYGAYYMNNGQETVGVSGQKPIFIDGTDATVNEWKGLIELYGDNYITLENLDVRNSGYYGVKVYDSSNISLIGLSVSGSEKTGLMLQDCGSNSISVSGCNISAKDIGVRVDNTDTVDITRNIIHDTGSYGVLVSSGGDSANIAENIIYSTIGNGIYLNKTENNSILRNLIYSSNKSGISTYITSSNDTSDNTKIVGNMIANTTGGGVDFYSEVNLTIPNFEMYNNSIVGCGVGLELSNNISFSNSNIKNNIFKDNSNQFSGSSNHAGVTFSNNLWSTSTSGAPAADSAIVIGNPLLSRADWSNITAGTLKVSDFALLENSPAINAGATISSPYHTLMNCDASDLPETVVLLNQSDHDGFEIGADIYSTSTTPDPDPYCGDGNCDAGEDIDTCPADCTPVVVDGLKISSYRLTSTTVALDSEVSEQIKQIMQEAGVKRVVIEDETTTD